MTANKNEDRVALHLGPSNQEDTRPQIRLGKHYEVSVTSALLRSSDCSAELSMEAELSSR